MRGVIITIAGTSGSGKRHALASDRVRSVTRCIRFGYGGLGHTMSMRRVRSVMRGRVVTAKTFRLTHGCMECHCGESLMHGTGAASGHVLSLVRCGGRSMGRRGSGGGPTIGDMRESCVTKRIDHSLAAEVLLPRSVIRTSERKVVRFRSSSCCTRRVRGYSLIGLRSVLRGKAIVDNAVVRGPRDFSATYGVTARVVTRITDGRCNKRDVSLARLTPFMSISERGVHGRIVDRRRLIKVRCPRSILGRVMREELGGRVAGNIRAVRCRIVALVAAGKRTPFLAIFVCLGRTGGRERGGSLTVVVRRALHRHCRKIGGRTKM